MPHHSTEGEEKAICVALQARASFLRLALSRDLRAYSAQSLPFCT